MAHSNSSRLRRFILSVLLMASFASSISFASIFDFLFKDQCTKSFRGISYLHGNITRRQEAAILGALTHFDAAAKKFNLKVEAWRDYSASDVESGRRSLLSLGEGESDFIAKSLTTRKRHGLSFDNIHAVDAAYHGNIMEVDPDFAQRSPFGFRAAQEKNFPANYHGQRFDVLDILDQRGKRILFDEIVSGNSLSYVLKASNAAMKTKILKRIALHANKNGILRFWNIYTRGGPLSEEINSTLADLKRLQIISSFGYLPNFDVFGQRQEGWYVIFP